MISRFLIVSLICAGLSTLTGCDDAKSAAGPHIKRFRVVTTTGMVTDMVRQVVGTHGEVIGLIGSGVDPHLFKATRHDIKLLQEANVVFYSGLKLEGRMQDALEQVNRVGRPVVAVTSKLDQSYLR